MEEVDAIFLESESAIFDYVCIANSIPKGTLVRDLAEIQAVREEGDLEKRKVEQVEKTTPSRGVG